MEESFKEKRKHVRFDNPNISLRGKDIAKKGPSDIAQAVAVNMSYEGVGILSNVELNPGSIIELDIAVPFAPRPSHLEGEVMWSKPKKAEDGGHVYASGIKLHIGKNDQTTYLMYICELMEQHIKKLEQELAKKSPPF